jgi:hypothetical protein
MSLHGNSTVVTASATTTETAVGTVSGTSFTANDPSVSGVLVRATVNVTASATGNTITYKIRQGNGTAGTTVFTATAIPFLTGVLTQSHVVEFVDTSATATGGNPLSYTVTATASAGTMTINSITTSAIGVSGAN